MLTQTLTCFNDIFANITNFSQRCDKPSNQMKKFMLKLLKHDNSIVLHSLEDAADLLYLQYDPFPLKENEFKPYFDVHPIPQRSIYRNSVMIGCRLLSTKSIKEIKESIHDDVIFLDWLKTNKIFLEAVTLSQKTIRTLGYLFFVHLQVTHHISLKGIYPRSYYWCPSLKRQSWGNQPKSFGILSIWISW